MSDSADTSAREAAGLLPFARKAGVMVMGRERIYREQKRLLFVMVCTDLSGNSRREIAQRITQIPVLERYSSAEIEQLAHLPNTKIIGFKKSPLSQRIFSLLKSTDQYSESVITEHENGLNVGTDESNPTKDSV